MMNFLSKITFNERLRSIIPFENTFL